jgi:hypothetical protein
MKIKQQSAALPTSEIISEIKPYTELLPTFTWAAFYHP